MGGLNWFDLVIIVALLSGMAVGYAQGLIRQLIGLAVLYVSLVLSTQFFRLLSQVYAGILHITPNTLTNMVAFFTIFFILMSLLNYLALDAYKATRIQIFPLIDHLTGMLVGLGSMWVIVSISVGVLTFAVGTQGWLQVEGLRAILETGVTQSRLADVSVSTLPTIISTIEPWLPGGLPALFK